MGKLIDLTGKKFGRLTVVARVPGTGRPVWKCLCECGKTTVVQGGHLRSGGIRSCGCLRSQLTVAKNTKHGRCSSGAYLKYMSMIDRCKETSVNRTSYFDRGITVCEEWLQAIGSFIKWADDNGYRPDLELDRVDNDKGYSPDNCRFVTRLENAHNRRTLNSMNKSGYAGVFFRKDHNKFESFVKSILIGGHKHLGWFATIEQAVEARNEFIKKHNLPHRIQEIKL